MVLGLSTRAVIMLSVLLLSRDVTIEYRIGLPSLFNYVNRSGDKALLRVCSVIYYIIITLQYGPKVYTSLINRSVF